jgi:hypothetical protein
MVNNFVLGKYQPLIVKDAVFKARNELEISIVLI